MKESNREGGYRLLWLDNVSPRYYLLEREDGRLYAGLSFFADRGITRRLVEDMVAEADNAYLHQKLETRVHMLENVFEYLEGVHTLPEWEKDSLRRRLRLEISLYRL